jgi:hypothetical protein
MLARGTTIKSPIDLFKSKDPQSLVDKKIDILEVANFDTSLLDTNLNVGFEEPYKLIHYDIDEFIRDLDIMLGRLAQNQPAWEGFDLNHEHVYDIKKDEIEVRYSVISRKPGTMSRTSKPGAGRAAHHYRLLDIADDPKNMSYAILVYGMLFDNIISITPWSKTYTTANRAARQLEDLILDYGHIFARNGLQQLRYEGRDGDQFQNTEQHPMFGCPLVVFARTLKIKYIYEKKLEEIAMQAYIKNE